MTLAPQLETMGGRIARSAARLLPASAAACLLLVSARAAIPAAAQQAAASGYEHFYNLEYPAAEADFQRACALTPDDPAAWNHLAEAYLYAEMYRVGALESQLYGHGNPYLVEKQLPTGSAAAASFNDAANHAANLATRALALHPDDADAVFDRAVTWAMRATFAFTLQKSYLPALSDARKAREDAVRTLRLDPGRVDPELILGIHNYVAGSLPLTERLFAAVIGYGGNRAQGIAQIQAVAERGEQDRTDAQVVLATIDRRDGRNRDAAVLLEHLSAQFPRNVLFAVETAEAYEAAGDHATALADYQLVLDRARQGAPGYAHAPLDKVWYDLGNIERLESRWQAAVADYLQAERAPDALPRYRQAAALSAGQCDELLGDRSAAEQQYRACVAVDPTTLAAHEAQRRLAH